MFPVALTFFLVGVFSLAPVPGEQVLNESMKPVYFEELAYPLAARLSHVEGVAVVQAEINDAGRVTSVIAISGPKMLIPDCLSNAKKWRFEPGTGPSVVIVYRFRFKGLCNLPCGSQFRFEPPNVGIITTGNPVVDHPQE